MKKLTAHKTPDEFLKRKKALLAARGNFPNLWDACAKHILPDRAEFLAKQEAGAENVTIFETAAIDANYVLAGWIWSQMTSPSLKWFKTSCKNRAKKGLWGVKRFFDEADEVMYGSFAQSNFYDTMSSFYLSLGAIGTDPIFMRAKTAPFKQYFKEFSVRDCLIAENQFGEVDTIYRPFEWTVHQMLEEWGLDALSDETKKLYHDKKEDAKVKLLHICEPRPNRDRNSDNADQMAFASVYMEEKAKHILEVGGYKTFPFVVGRFYRWGDTAYGRSPGMLSLPDIRTADKQDQTNLKVGQRIGTPPLNVPFGMKGKVRMAPDGLNYLGKNDKSGIEPVNIGNGLPYTLEMQKDRVEKIERKFFKNIIMMLDSSGSTYKNIPEILAREQEKMSVIGAPIGRLMHQVLSPIIAWSFMSHLENGMLPEVPPELEGEDLDVEYISPLAMTLKQLEGGSMARALEMSAPAMQMDPTAVDEVDARKIVRKNFTIYGADGVLRSPDEVAAVRQTRQEAQRAQEMDQGMMDMAQGVKTLAEADRASGGKLSEMVEE